MTAAGEPGPEAGPAAEPAPATGGATVRGPPVAAARPRVDGG